MAANAAARNPTTMPSSHSSPLEAAAAALESAAFAQRAEAKPRAPQFNFGGRPATSTASTNHEQQKWKPATHHSARPSTHPISHSANVGLAVSTDAIESKAEIGSDMHDDSDDSDNDDRGSSVAGQLDGAGSASGVGAAQSLSADAAAAAKRAAKKAKRAAQKAEKKRKATAHLQEKGGLQSVITPGVASEHPFEVDPRDHAETPFEAYQDIEPLLFKLAERLGTTKAKLRIYDPYFCEGSMAAHMRRLGFENVYNKNEDFYAVVEEGRVPDHDILVTNPPFSGDHMARILDFATHKNQGRPWMLLMPQFVSKKAYYLEWIKSLQDTSSNAGSSGEIADLAARDAAAGGGDDVADLHPATAAKHLAPSGQSSTAAAATKTKQTGKQSLTAAAASSTSSTAAPASAGASRSTPAPTPPCKPLYLGPKQKAYSFSAPGRSLDGASKLVKDRTFESNRAFQVFAGSFQCIWFINFGNKDNNQSKILEWWRKKYGAIAKCAISDTVEGLPQLMAVPKEAPSKRRWRKKLSRLHKRTGGSVSGSGGEGSVGHYDDDGDDAGSGRGSVDDEGNGRAFLPAAGHRTTGSGTGAVAGQKRGRPGDNPPQHHTASSNRSRGSDDDDDGNGRDLFAPSSSSKKQQQHQHSKHKQHPNDKAAAGGFVPGGMQRPGSKSATGKQQQQQQHAKSKKQKLF